MTPEDQRISIAEACGFKRETCPGGIYWYNPDHPLCGDGRAINDEEELPDYLNDLNAAHEMESNISEREQDKYCVNLAVVVESDPDDNPQKISDMLEDDYWRVAHATAAQRCKAFLRTLGLWKEGK